jgi:opacity protein-like surface antigen
MCTVRWSFAAGILAFLLSGQTMAQQTASTPLLLQPSSVRQATLTTEDYLSFTPQPDAGGAPPAPGNQPAAKPEASAEPQGEAKAEEEEKKEDEDTGFKLFKGPWLECHRIDIRGWLDQGFTWNPDNPVSRFNGPVGYNDRSNEYQLNQLYLIMERVTKTDECNPLDVGGRVDLLYGTDRRFVEARGLDTEWGNRFYGLAMPQMYADVAINNLVLRGGHFLAPCGYESVMAPENFFRSHTYQFLYGQPTTLTGGSAIYKINDQWSVNCGLDGGWNNWVDAAGKVNYMGGWNWTSEDKKRTLAYEAFIGEQLPGVDSNLTHYCLVFTQKLGEKWTYALEHNLGYETNAIALPNGNRTHGDWFGLASYLLCDINDKWSWGIRYEWFNDDDGTVVAEVGPPATSPVPSHYTDLSFGLNYKPNKNIIVRSEVRYDHSTAKVFESFTTQDQFLWSIDAIVRF